MVKAIYFDMDGTIANLYQIKNWLDKLLACNPAPYHEAEPMYNMEELSNILQELQNKGWQIGVISWLSKNADKVYADRIRYAKKKWLKKHLKINLNELHFTKYGKEKFNIAKHKPGILIDDNEEVRKNWEARGGIAINPTAELLDFLKELGK